MIRQELVSERIVPPQIQQQDVDDEGDYAGAGVGTNRGTTHSGAFC